MPKLGNVQVSKPFSLEIAEFRFAQGAVGAVGIFHNRGQCGISHHKSTAPPCVKLVREQAEGIGVTVEARHVHPFSLRQFFAVGRNEFAQPSALTFAEIRAYGLFARVSEGRIPHVVSQAGRTDNGPHARHFGMFQFGVSGNEFAAHVCSERTSHARHFEAVCQSVMHEHAAGQRKYLGLVLQTAERGRKYQSVEVALKLRASFFEPCGLVFLAQSFGRYELLPVHHVCVGADFSKGLILRNCLKIEVV